MNIKKSLVYLTGLMLLPLVSAFGFGYFDLRQGMSQIIQWIVDFTSPFFEVVIGDYSSSQFFFAKVILLILMFVIILTILKKSEFLGLSKNSSVTIIISAIVSILAIRFLPDNTLISGILLPYGVMGIALTTFLPLLIYFFFVHEAVPGHAGRRMAWGLYAIIFLALWNSREVNLSDTSNWIYISAIGLVILFFIFDSKFHEYFGLGDFRKFGKESNFWRRIEISEKLEKLQKARTSGAISEREYEKEMEKLTDRAKEFAED